MPDKPSMTVRPYDKIYPRVEKINLYPIEEVGHLVDQLIKLQQEYTNSYNRANHVDKKQIYVAMERLNKTLNEILTFNLINNN